MSFLKREAFMCTVKEQRDAAVKLLAQWCLAIDENGTGWDDWDEFYKDAAFRPGPLRDLIDADMKKYKRSE